jgi:hypothetical protein
VLSTQDSALKKKKHSTVDIAFVKREDKSGINLKTMIYAIIIVTKKGSKSKNIKTDMHNFQGRVHYIYNLINGKLGMLVPLQW